MCKHCTEYRQRIARLERKIEEYTENVTEKIEHLDRLAKAAAKAIAES